MSIFMVLVFTWALLMLRSGIVEYKYYQSVKAFEPDIWQKLGSPKFIKIPFVFVSPKGLTLLREVSNKTVCELAIKHRQFGIQFLIYIMLVLVVSIVYFNIA
jgi:hypothetical protein